MKKYLFLSYLLLILAGAFSLVSCSSDDVGIEGPNSQNKQLVGTKWTTTNWDYSIGDDWAGMFDETYNIFFYSQTEGLFYYGRKDLDSDFGSSSSRSVAHFTYNVEGGDIKLDYINNPMGFSSRLKLAGNTISMNGINFQKGTIGSSDNTWLNTLHGPTGDCKWYYDLSGSLYVKGEGNMADYTSFSSTPWGMNNRIPNYVEIQKGVTSIGACAFANPSIGEVYISSNAKLKKIGASAFEGTCISSINLPSEIMVIGESAFSGCNYLTKAYMPGMIEEIGSYAFSGCKSASLLLTKNLRRIGAGAFMGCEVSSWTDSPVLEEVGEMALSNCSFQKLVLPNSVVSLGHLAFGGKISEIHIGTGQLTATGTPFATTKSGKLYVNQNNPMPLADDIVDVNNVRNWTLYVPSGSKSAYSKAEYWKNFKTIIEDSTLDGDRTDTEGTDDNEDQNGSVSETDPNKPKIIETGEAIPTYYGVKFYGHVNPLSEPGNVDIQITTSPDMHEPTGTCVMSKYCTTEQDFSGEYDYSEIWTDGKTHGMSHNTKYYYRAVFKTKSGKFYYGEIKSFTTLSLRTPSNLTYTLDEQTYKMILVSGGPNGDFYMMQTELPLSSDIYIEGEKITRMDTEGTTNGKIGDGYVVKREFRNFLEELRKKTGIEWRLPTPEEWKFAAKGGNKSNGTTYSGSNNIADVAWHKGNSNGSVHNGALKKPNELGFYDMSGNYAELTNPIIDPANVDGPFYGGCWNDAASQCTVTSYKSGITTGNIQGSTLKEKNAFDGHYITVRLVYSAK